MPESGSFGSMEGGGGEAESCLLAAFLHMDIFARAFARENFPSRPSGTVVNFRTGEGFLAPIVWSKDDTRVAVIVSAIVYRARTEPSASRKVRGLVMCRLAQRRADVGRRASGMWPGDNMMGEAFVLCMPQPQASRTRSFFSFFFLLLIITTTEASNEGDAKLGSSVCGRSSGGGTCCVVLLLCYYYCDGSLASRYRRRSLAAAAWAQRGVCCWAAPRAWEAGDPACGSGRDWGRWAGGRRFRCRSVVCLGFSWSHRVAVARHGNDGCQRVRVRVRLGVRLGRSTWLLLLILLLFFFFLHEMCGVQLFSCAEAVLTAAQLRLQAATKVGCEGCFGVAQTRLFAVIVVVVVVVVVSVAVRVDGRWRRGGTCKRWMRASFGRGGERGVPLYSSSSRRRKVKHQDDHRQSILHRPLQSTLCRGYRVHACSGTGLDLYLVHQEQALYEFGCMLGSRSNAGCTCPAFGRGANNDTVGSRRCY
jgi:hypothetical protein